MKSRLFCEALETRENPSGPDLLSPTTPVYTDPNPPPATPAPTPPPVNTNFVPVNPWGS